MNTFISKLIRVAKRGWYGFAFIFFLSTLPNLYAINVRLPDASQWQHASGIVKIETSRKHGGNVITIGGKTFVCRGFSGNSQCIKDADVALWNGRAAQLSWFRQPIYPLIANNRPVELIIDGVTVIPAAQTRAQIEHEARIRPDDADWFDLGLILVVGIAATLLSLLTARVASSIARPKQPKSVDQSVGGPR